MFEYCKIIQIICYILLYIQLIESFHLKSTMKIATNGFTSLQMSHNTKNIQPKSLFKGIAAFLLSSSLFVSPNLADTGFQSQLQLIRQQQIETQRTETDRIEQELMSKEILYPEGRLIARGKVCLTPAKNGDFDKVNFPFGLFKATDLDEALENDQASLFLLAVGREGPPVAAVRYKLKDIKFPFVFEITTDNLLFPYTAEAWTRSANSKDTTAVTVIISLDEFLSTPSESEWVGFGLSNPVVIAGVQSRSSAELAIKGKIEKNLYTESEINSLKGIDNEIAKLEDTQSKLTLK